jgi:hypothetical protein
VVDEHRVVVGFSRLRPSRVRSGLRRVRHRLGLGPNIGNRPTRIAMYDLRTQRLEWEHDVEEAGLNGVFSVHPCG